MLKTQVQLPDLDSSPGLETSETLALLSPEWGKNSCSISFAVLPVLSPNTRSMFQYCHQVFWPVLHSSLSEQNRK